MISPFRCVALVACNALLLGVAELRAGSSSAGAPALQIPSASGSFTLSVSRDTGTFISLDAEDARLSDVAARLATLLGMPVSVSPAAAEERISTSFAQLPFETALSALAWRAYVDYELRPGTAVPLEVRLATADDPQPAPRFPAIGVLIAGHTDDMSDSVTRDPLRLSLEDGRLTIVVERQPLGLVIAAAAETLNVPFDIEYGAAEIVNASLIRLPPEIALLRLSPNVRVFVRADLYRGDRTVQRIVVAPPSAR
jgi:hypothetical protein